jgi:hypothetical protein
LLLRLLLLLRFLLLLPLLLLLLLLLRLLLLLLDGNRLFHQHLWQPLDHLAGAVHAAIHAGDAAEVNHPDVPLEIRVLHYLPRRRRVDADDA